MHPSTLNFNPFLGTILIVIKEPDPPRPLSARALGNLRRVPTAQIDRVVPSVRARDLRNLYRFEVNFDAHAGFVFRVIDEDEFAAFGFGEVVENGAVVFLKSGR